MRADALAIVGLCLFALGVQGAFAQMYKWTDEKGRVVYSDKPPPEKDNKGGVQMSNRGIVVKKLDGGMTTDQRKAKDEDDARRKVEEAKLAEQKRQDNALLQSFTSTKEIELKRDREIQGLDMSVMNLRTQERSVSERLLEDRKRLESYQNRKKPVPDSVREDIARAEAEKKVLDDEIKRKLDETVAIRNKYEALKKRYIELKQESAAGTIQPATAASSPPAKK
jgi:hypothetical protein